MTIEQMRRKFDEIAKQRREAGDLDGAAQAELLREYFLNEKFRTQLADDLWNMEQAKN